MPKIFTFIGICFCVAILYGLDPVVSIEAGSLQKQGEILVQNRCSSCHGLERINRRAGQNLAFWERTVDRMKAKRHGLLNQEERLAVLMYLTNH